jgi:hypothetical protein
MIEVGADGLLVWRCAQASFRERKYSVPSKAVGARPPKRGAVGV